jgi:tRNA A37 threonylcarbamoyladenosine modification protein TsaB
MLILAIDSSRKTLSFAVFDSVKQNYLLKHSLLAQSSTLINSIIDSFAELSLRPEQVDLFLLSTGPGSFTGIRNTLSIVQTLVSQLNLPYLSFNNFQLTRFLTGLESEHLAIKAGTNDFFVSLDTDYTNSATNFYSPSLPHAVRLCEIDNINLSELMIELINTNPELINLATKEYRLLQPYYLRQASIGNKSNR